MRAQFLLHCASDGQVENFLDGKELRAETPGKLDKLDLVDLIEALQALPGFHERSLKVIKNRAWKALCDYAHVGGRLVNQWNSPKGIEPHFRSDEIDSVLKLICSFAALATLGMCEFNNDETFAERILEQIKFFHLLRAAPTN